MTRSSLAAILVTLALGAVLIAWFVAGRSEVKARQRAAREAPVAAAVRDAERIALQLRDELGRLMDVESGRPYFHYQSLFHDPRSSSPTAVAPSPLADGVPTPHVLGYFQLDTTGRASTPTVNPELPELSEPTRLADNRAFLEAVARDFAQLSKGNAQPTTPAGRLAVTPPAAEVGRPPVTREEPQPGPSQAAQVIELAPNAYVQNVAPNQVYQQARSIPVLPVQAAPTVTAPVTIVVSPLEWRTEAFRGEPALLATRTVATPDGVLTQGFVLDRDSLIRSLGARGDRSVQLVPPRDPGTMAVAGAVAAPVIAGWHVALTPSAAATEESAANAATYARDFVIQFVLIALPVTLAGVLVVVLVARSERLARERSQFAAAAAHELRTPLAGLQLYGEMLADGLGDPAKQRDYSRRISDEAARLGRVVSNVLGFSELEHGNISVDVRVGSLDEELRKLAERVETALERAGASLTLDVAPDLSARFDTDALARIIANLLDNAEKYSRGAADRTIKLAARAVANGVEVAVSDHGPGPSPDIGAKLFRPFVRGGAPDAPAGLGLGLALSRALARAMGGELTHRPNVGGGAVFVVLLARP